MRELFNKKHFNFVKKLIKINNRLLIKKSLNLIKN